MCIRGRYDGVPVLLGLVGKEMEAKVDVKKRSRAFRRFEALILLAAGLTVEALGGATGIERGAN